MEDLISEEFSDEFSILGEEEIRDGKKQICFKGIFSEADKINRNHRVYPKAILKEALENALEESKKTGQPIIGELEHASDSKIRLERIAVTFPTDELHWDEERNAIVGKAVPTLTEAGKLVEGLAKSGLKICFSTRCAGKVKPYKGPLIAEDARPVVEVCPGLKIISIDVIQTPSCQSAVSDTVYESTITEDVKSKKTFKEVFDSEF